MEIHLSDWQSQIWDDPHRFITLACGRRAGKTTLAALKMIDFATKNPKSIAYYISPTYRQSEQIMWRMVKDFLPKHAIKQTNETKLRLELKNGSFIELKGADAEPDALRGVRIDYLICDEVASFKSWKRVWEEVLRPALTDTKGHAMFIGTPKGYNHFYELYNKIDTDYASFKFTSYDNPYQDKEEIDKARVETDEDAFQQEYMAEFKKYSGLVYKDFARERHLIEPFQIPGHYTLYRGIDFGFYHPSAVIFLAVSDKGEYIVYDLVYRSGLKTPELAKLIADRSVNKNFITTVADSASAGDIAELNGYGISVQPVEKISGDNFETWTMFKTRKLAELFRSGRIKIFNTLKPLVDELESYQYREVREGTVTREIPLKLNDDAINALEYLIVSLPEQLERTYSNQVYTPYNKQKWSI